MIGIVELFRGDDGRRRVDHHQPDHAEQHDDREEDAIDREAARHQAVLPVPLARLRTILRKSSPRSSKLLYASNEAHAGASSTTSPVRASARARLTASERSDASAVAAAPFSDRRDHGPRFAEGHDPPDTAGALERRAQHLEVATLVVAAQQQDDRLVNADSARERRSHVGGLGVVDVAHAVDRADRLRDGATVARRRRRPARSRSAPRRSARPRPRRPARSRGCGGPASGCRPRS